MLVTRLLGSTRGRLSPTPPFFLMKRFVFFAALGLGLAFVLAPVRTSAQPPQPPPDRAEQYRQLVSEGLREFAAGRHEEALVLFLDAHEIEPNARTFRALGAVSYELRRYADAVSYFESALASEARPLSGQQRQEVTQARDRAARFIGHFRVVVVDPADGYRVTLDGNRISINRPLVLQAPEVHVLEVSATGYQTFQRTLDVRGRENETIEVVLEEQRAGGNPFQDGNGNGNGRGGDDGSGGDVEGPSRGLLYGGIASFAVAGVGLLTFAVAGGIASGDFQDLDATVRRECGVEVSEGCPSEAEFEDSVSSIQTNAVIADVGLGLGLAAAVTGTILIIVDMKSGDGAEDEETAGIRWHLGGSLQGMSLGLEGSF